MALVSTISQCYLLSTLHYTTSLARSRLARSRLARQPAHVAQPVRAVRHLRVAARHHRRRLDPAQNQQRVHAVAAAKRHVRVETVAHHQAARHVQMVVAADRRHHAGVRFAADGVRLTAARHGHNVHHGPCARQLRLHVRERRVHVGGHEGDAFVQQVLHGHAHLEVREVEVEPDHHTAHVVSHQALHVVHRQLRRVHRRHQVRPRRGFEPQRLQLLHNPALAQHPDLLLALRQRNEVPHVQRSGVGRVDDLVHGDAANAKAGKLVHVVLSRLGGVVGHKETLLVQRLEQLKRLLHAWEDLAANPHNTVTIKQKRVVFVEDFFSNCLVYLDGHCSSVINRRGCLVARKEKIREENKRKKKQTKEGNKGTQYLM